MQGVTFDVDGTLYDSWAQHLRAVPYLWRSPRIVASFRRQFESLRGERFEDFRAELHQRIAQDLRFELPIVEAAVQQAMYENWPASFSNQTPLPGLADLLEAIDAAGIPRAIISDNPSLAKLKAMGIAEGWAAIVDCSALGALKPLPDGLQAASEHMNIAPDRLVHIGDRDNTDGEMARALGAGFLLRGTAWNSLKELTAELGLALPRHSS
ncbi:MAG: HAD family hydrolase [Myxococcota bacterium]|nr:HAD family hydrolase [Myxococcota bacterium]